MEFIKLVIFTLKDIINTSYRLGKHLRIMGGEQTLHHPNSFLLVSVPLIPSHLTRIGLFTCFHLRECGNRDEIPLQPCYMPLS